MKPDELIKYLHNKHSLIEEIIYFNDDKQAFIIKDLNKITFDDSNYDIVEQYLHISEEIDILSDKKYPLYVYEKDSSLKYRLFTIIKDGELIYSAVKKRNIEETDETEYKILRPLKRLNNLCIGEILLLNWLNLKNDNKTIPDYFVRQYFINPIKIKKKLISKQLIIPASTFESLEGLKVSSLRDICKQCNLKISGRKTDVVTRLINSLSENKLRQFKLPLIWKLSATGKQIVDKAQILVWAHQQISHSRLMDITEFVKYIPATAPFEKYGIEVCNDNLDRLFKEDKDDYYGKWRYVKNCSYFYMTMKEYINSLAYEMFYVVAVFFCVRNFYFSFLEGMPTIKETAILQSDVLDFYSKTHFNDEMLLNSAKIFINKFQHYLPDYAKLNEQQIIRLFIDFIKLDPKEMNEIRLQYIKKCVPANKRPYYENYLGI